MSLNRLISFEIMLLALYQQLLIGNDLQLYIRQVAIENQDCGH